MLTIENGIIYVNEKETTNPELIGLALLDLIEEFPELKLNKSL